MRIGVLTGGGDCPGLNAVIRAIVRKGVEVHGHEFVGYRDGWRGPLEGDSGPLGVPEVRGILPRGGTILGSSRTNPFKRGRRCRARSPRTSSAAGVDGLIAIGGEDTLGRRLAAARRARRHRSSACRRRSTTTSAPPTTPSASTPRSTSRWRRSTACTPRPSSHHRVLIVEVMGRHAGWIALHAGLAGGANVDPDPGAALRPRRRSASCVERRLRGPVRPDRRRLRGRRAGRRACPSADDGQARRLRPRPARRHRPLARGRDREPHRQGDPRDRPRPRPARRHPDRLRPRAGDPLRPRTRSTPPTTATGA